jgi:hypothetical protein
MRLKVLIGFVVLTVVFNTSVAQSTWQEVMLDTAGISLDYPETPIVKKRDLHTEIGILSSMSVSFAPESKKPNFLYSLNVVFYPESTLSNDSIEMNSAIANSLIDGLAEEHKCKLTYATESIKNGLPCVLYRMMDDVSGQVVKGMVMVHNNKTFVLSVFTKKEQSLNDDIDRFLNSIKFNN